MRRCGLVLAGWILGTILPLLAAAPSGAASIEIWPIGQTQSQPLAIKPMAKSETLEFRDLSRVAFRYVISDSTGAELMAFSGTGKLQTSGAKPLWQWQVDRLAAGGQTFDADKPLATVLMQTDRRGAVTRSQAQFPGFVTGGDPEPGSLLHLFTTWLVAGLSRGFVALPEGAVKPNGDVADPNIYFEGFLTGVSPDALITKRLPMAKALGVAEYADADVIVARAQGEMVAERLADRTVVQVDGHSLVDLDTGLPVYTDHKVHYRIERASGDPIDADLVIRTYLQY